MKDVKENKYMCAVFQAFSEFIQEESLGRCFTELRLKKAIEEARTRFPGEYDAMIGTIEIKDIPITRFDKMNVVSRIKRRQDVQCN